MFEKRRMAILGHHPDDKEGIGEIFFGKRKKEPNGGLRVRTKVEEFI